MKHTPGPWSIGKSYTDEICIRESKGHELQAIAVCGSEMLANANLIAAAPELLEACKAMAEYISGQWDWGGEWKDRPNCLRLAELAIKKAEEGE